jgi:hypothetical protein
VHAEESHRELVGRDNREPAGLLSPLERPRQSDLVPLSGPLRAEERGQAAVNGDEPDERLRG